MFYNERSTLPYLRWTNQISQRKLMSIKDPSNICVSLKSSRQESARWKTRDWLQVLVSKCKVWKKTRFKKCKENKKIDGGISSIHSQILQLIVWSCLSPAVEMSDQHRNLKRDHVTSAGLGGDAEEVAQSVRVLAAHPWGSEFGSQHSRGGVLIWNPSLGEEVNGTSPAWLQVPQRPDLKGIGVEWQRRHWTSLCGPHVCTGSSQCTCTHTCTHQIHTAMANLDCWHIMEEGTSAEELFSSNWPVTMSVRDGGC